MHSLVTLALYLLLCLQCMLVLVSLVGTGLKCFGAIPIRSHILLNFSTAFYETLTSKYMYWKTLPFVENLSWKGDLDGHLLAVKYIVWWPERVKKGKEQSESNSVVFNDTNQLVKEVVVFFLSLNVLCNRVFTKSLSPMVYWLLKGLLLPPVKILFTGSWFVVNKN